MRGRVALALVLSIAGGAGCRTGLLDETGADDRVVIGGGPEAIIQIAGAADYTCALRRSGRIACWGGGYYRALWEVDRDRPTPSPLDGVDDAVEISVAESFGCARRAGGTVVCWGGNQGGQLGDGRSDGHGRCGRPRDGDCSVAPVAVAGITDAVEVTVGAAHACARRAGGDVWCWGDNRFGQLGDGTATSRPTPAPARGLDDAEEIDAGETHTCARRRGGRVVCWGWALNGALGDGGTERPPCGMNEPCSPLPVEVAGIDDAVEISAGLHAGCARRAGGGVRCWGWDDVGQAGGGTSSQARPTPVDVVDLVAARTVYTGYLFACAATRDGAALCWGLDPIATLRGADAGEDGPRPSLRPTAVDGLDGIVGVAGGWYHACALDVRGEVRCWGNGRLHQLGDGAQTNRSTPVRVPL